jgi:primase-polymerase (primpol)-like protein
MLDRKQWICWRYEPNPKGGKDLKVPYSPLSGKKAQVNNPATWASYDEAVQAMKKYSYSGIGFVFTVESGIVAIDIDNCLAGEELNEILLPRLNIGQFKQHI